MQSFQSGRMLAREIELSGPTDLIPMYIKYTWAFSTIPNSLPIRHATDGNSFSFSDQVVKSVDLLIQVKSGLR